MDVTLIASTAMGLESVLQREIKALGIESVRVFNNKVEFDATEKDICRSNLWLRTAGRIYIKIAEFKVKTFDELFEQTKAQDWAKWIQKDDQFPVTKVSSIKSELFSKSDCQAIVKKAIAESLKANYKCDTLPETNAIFPIRIQIERDVVILSIDSSGDGLNKRGYRAHMDSAPLRETLAAGLILLSRWHPQKDILLDPFCGTGTILVEAGLIAKNSAPGLNRNFISESWQALDPSHWTSARTEASDQIIHNADYCILGSDYNEKTLHIARKNCELAGLPNIDLKHRALKDLSSNDASGKLITNPPYGERMSNYHEVERLYNDMGNTFRRVIPNWSYYILTRKENFETLFGEKSTKHRKLFNGGMKCYYFQYFKKP